MAINKTIYVRTTEPDYVIEARAVRVGQDILVWVWGGDRAHIGAVAAAQPRPSLLDPTCTSATASILCYPGHKEGNVAKDVAETLASRFNINVVATVGIHWDALSPEGIAVIIDRCHEITALLSDALEG